LKSTRGRKGRTGIDKVKKRIFKRHGRADSEGNTRKIQMFGNEPINKLCNRRIG